MESPLDIVEKTERRHKCDRAQKARKIKQKREKMVTKGNKIGEIVHDSEVSLCKMHNK